MEHLSLVSGLLVGLANLISLTCNSSQQDTPVTVQ